MESTVEICCRKLEATFPVDSYGAISFVGSHDDVMWGGLIDGVEMWYEYIYIYLFIIFRILCIHKKLI